jgi:hypothetical protein
VKAAAPMPTLPDPPAPGPTGETQPPVGPPADPKPEATPAKHGDKCPHCGTKKRKLSAPSEKQLVARQKFAEKAREAKQLRASEPGVKYRDAMKRVYGR